MDEDHAQNILFEVATPLGFRVRVTRSYWDLITTYPTETIKEGVKVWPR